MAKERTSISIDKNIKNQITEIYKADNCKSTSEFIEKAIKFYIGYLKQEGNANYLSPLITETMKSLLAGSEQRLSRLMFKEAVEIAKLGNIVAALNDIDSQTLKELHVRCVQEVSKINGIFSLDKAVEFQKGED